MPAFRCITPPPPVETLRLPHRLESLCYNHPRSAVHSVVLHGPPSTIHCPPSISRFAVCGPRSILPSAVPHSFIRSPFVDGLPLPTASKTHVQPSTLHRPPSISQSILPSAVPHSFIRSPFVDGLPLPRLPSISRSAVCGPRSILRSAVCGPRSILLSAVRGPRSEINLTPRRPRCLISEPG